MRTAIALVAALCGLVLLIPLLLVVVPFWLVAAATRALSHVVERPYLTRDQLIAFDPIFGWKARPNLDTYHLTVDLFHIETDADGWRGRTPLAESDVVVFGDSFAAGYGVSEEHLFANLQAHPRVKPIGIGGYSMVQELLWIQTLAPRLAGKLVVWFVYLGNDLYDNLSPDLRGYRKPFVRALRDGGEWEIVSSHVSAEQWPIVPRLGYARIHPVKLAELCSGGFLAERAFGACEFLIRQGRAVCAEAGADLVVLSIPDPLQLTPEGRRQLEAMVPGLANFDADSPDRQLAAMCRRLAVPFTPGQSVFDVSCYRTDDCHWNEWGHRTAAQWLARTYARRREHVGLRPASFEPMLMTSTASVAAK
jgi:hypothetical protein